MSDDVEKAERILRGECTECGGPGGAHTKECVNNIWTQLEFRLDNVSTQIKDYQQEARDWTEKHPEEVEKWIEEYKKRNV